ncbi:MAG: C39 family peptidase, partial [Clostridia bacterium]|nr:C39 family peptidase [Clostridia bacterium]
NIMDKIGDTAVTITSGIMKMIVKVIRPILSIADTVGDTVDGVKSAGKNAYNTAKTAVGKAKDSVVSWASDKLDTAKGWINSWAGDGSHVSQYDPRYAGRRFGRHTVADKGCGPAVAASVLRAYGRNSSLGDTINYAEANGYVAGASGTRAGYFNDIFAANGISSAYTDNRKIMKQSIKSGRPTVLLGQDTGNGSKLRSPFGPNPHYVVAHGMDRRGNLIVDDPELGSTALYKNSILNKAKLGVITGGDSGATIDGNTTEAKVWQFFTQNGFTPAATAGIMGSIYQESKFKPDMIQGNGAGPAAGLFQWENYNNKSRRWKALNDFAAARGKNWTDLQTQLEYALHEMTTSEKWMWNSKAHSNYAGVSSLDEYKQITNPVVAAEAFENHFERAGKPMMGVRKQKATEYYNMFSGSKISNPTIFNSSSYSTGNTTSGTDLGSLIGGVFNKVLGAAFGAMGKFGQFLSGAFGLNNGSSSNGLSGVDYTYSGNTGSYSGPDPMKGVGENAVALMRAIEGKNQYSMDSTKREQVFASLEGQKTGYGDCSATVRKVLQKVTGKNIGGNTEDQYVNYASRGGVVVNSGKIDESKLAPGDALYYARPTSSYTVGRKDRVGHVEMYIGNGQRMGHGSGMGPKVSSLDSDSSRFLKAIRFTAAGSGLMNNKPEALNVIDFSKYTGAGSRPVNGDNIASYTRSTMENINSKARRYIGGDSGVSAELISMIAQAVEYLKSINSNTAHNALLAEIVSLMTQLTQVVAATGSAQRDTAEDTDVLRSQTADILNRLTAMAKAV